MKTLLCLILDESGSMGGNEDAVVEGFNALLADQLKNKGETNFYFIKFNHTVTTIYNNVPLPRVPRMTRSLYRPYGRTALYDAISKGIEIMEKNVASVDRVIMVIFTDGKENGSRFSNEAKTKEFFAKFQRNGNWSFLYIGEDSKQFSEKMEIPAGNTIDFRHGNIKANFVAASHACTTLRDTEQLQADNLLEDFTREETGTELIEEIVVKKKEEKEVEAAPPKLEELRSDAVDTTTEPLNEDDDVINFALGKANEIREFAKKSYVNLLLLLFMLYTFYYFFPYFMAIILVVLAMDYYETNYNSFRLPVNDKK